MLVSPKLHPQPISLLGFISDNYQPTGHLYSTYSNSDILNSICSKLKYFYISLPLHCLPFLFPILGNLHQQSPYQLSRNSKVIPSVHLLFYFPYSISCMSYRFYLSLKKFPHPQFITLLVCHDYINSFLLISCFQFFFSLVHSEHC